MLWIFSACLMVAQATTDTPTPEPSAAVDAPEPVAATAEGNGSATVAPSEAPGADAGYCPEGVAPDTTALERGITLRRLGQTEAARAALCQAAAAPETRLQALQQLRRVFADGNRSPGFDDLLADLVRAHTDAGNGQLAGARKGELRALNPEHPALEELDAMTRKRGGEDGGSTSWTARARSLFGMLVLLGIAYALSNNRKKIRFRLVAWGMGLQALFAVLILLTPPGRWVFEKTKNVITLILGFTDEGASFVFGNLYNGIAANGAQGPVSYVDGTTGDIMSLGMIFVMHVLPTIIFFGALMSILYHLGLIQKIVHVIAVAMAKTMGTSGAESLSAAGNIFVGQTEAPLVIKPYLDGMTRSELMAIMTGGFATVAGGVLAAYTRFGLDPGHLLAASVMSAPAALVVAKIMYPEIEQSETAAGVDHDPERATSNVIDAAASGATDGLKLAANVGAMLIAFIGLIALLNAGIGWIGSFFGADSLALRDIFGVIFYPLSWCMGVDTQDLLDFGNLLGVKISINEFVAFVELGALKDQMTDRSFTIATYALTGFANFSSIGIQIGGIAAIAPKRRADLAQIGLKAMIGGAIASWLTACIAGLLL